MIGSQYVSDPERWRVFYEDLLGGKIDTKQYRPNRKPYVIPVSRITPMKAVENRAKVELREAVREGEPHVPLQKTIKGTSTPRVLSLASKRKANGDVSTSSKKRKVEKSQILSIKQTPNTGRQSARKPRTKQAPNNFD
ncbi:hypothetical protein BOW47_12265 [Solemya velum gill symbiont]|nr:hypothetical protein BOW47_12265 [Solemya velum gill symbiont]